MQNSASGNSPPPPSMRGGGEIASNTHITAGQYRGVQRALESGGRDFSDRVKEQCGQEGSELGHEQGEFQQK